MRLLVTGGAGFIGSNFIRYMLQSRHASHITNLDKLTYAGNLTNLSTVEKDSRYNFVKGDITDSQQVSGILDKGYDAIVNFAAESHVDRSILDSSPFIETNVKGTQVLLECARQYKVKFFQVSTDEVYGSLGAQGKFSEESPLLPNSPYAASKACADLLCRAYHKTYGMPIINTRCSNNYGPYQFPEKLIPLVISNALENKPIPVYGDGLNVRDWIYVEDHCRAIDAVIHKGKPGEVYNIGCDNEKTNLYIIEVLLNELGKPKSLITFVTDRPGHDRRYALDTNKIRHELGWEPTVSFEEGIKSSARWYVENASWWQAIKSGDYASYYDTVYSQR